MAAEAKVNEEIRQILGALEKVPSGSVLLAEDGRWLALLWAYPQHIVVNDFNVMRFWGHQHIPPRALYAHVSIDSSGAVASWCLSDVDGGFRITSAAAKQAAQEVSSDMSMATILKDKIIVKGNGFDRWLIVDLWKIVGMYMHC